MTHAHRPDVDAPAASSKPTPFADLNAVLGELVDGARRRLGGDFVGAYLQGSFALGDFDAQSDVDFVIAVDRDLDEGELASLQALHETLHDRPNPWAQRLEGSYFPVAILRRWSLSPRDPPGQPPRPSDWADPGTGGRPPRVYPVLFKGNGERRLVRSEHDNTQVVRWVTRERGITLSGPPATQLIDPIDPQALKDEATALITESGWRNDPSQMGSRWLQAFFVLLFCRLLHTARHGDVVSKKAAADEACAILDPRWTPLIRSAQAARLEPAEIGRATADPRELAATLDFIDDVVRRVGESDGTHAPQRARDVIARALALKKQGARAPGAVHADLRGGPNGRRSGFTPPPIRPGGRGRRG
jgi:hypothetical protein